MFVKNCKEYETFLSSIDNEKTKSTYISGLKKFEKWINLEHSSFNSWNELIKLSGKDIDSILKNYVLFLKNDVSANSVSNLMVPVTNFFLVNDVYFNKDAIRKWYPKPTKKGNQHGYSLSMIQSMLKVAKTKRDVALLLFLESGGLRSGAPEDLRICDVSDYEKGCKIITVYPDDVAEYETFITPEASIALNEYFDERRLKGEILSPKSPLFAVSRKYCPGKSSEMGPMKWKSVYEMLEKLVKLSGIERKKSFNARFDIAMVHGLRKFFYTQLIAANVHPYNIKKLVGHKTGLEEIYGDQSTAQIFKEFSAAIPFLTISKDLRQLNEIVKLKDENSELKYEQEFSQMKNDISELKDLFKDFINR